jgi:hypothetical protein
VWLGFRPERQQDVELGINRDDRRTNYQRPTATKGGAAHYRSGS